MEHSYIVYAESLSAIGDKITEISNGLLDVNNVDFQVNYDQLSKAVEGYNKCRISLSNIVPPNKVAKEHKEIINAIQMFIDGTELMRKSLDIESLTADMDQITKGSILQNKGKENIVKLTDMISLILLDK